MKGVSRIWERKKIEGMRQRATCRTRREIQGRVVVACYPRIPFLFFFHRRRNVVERANCRVGGDWRMIGPWDWEEDADPEGEGGQLSGSCRAAGETEERSGRSSRVEERGMAWAGRWREAGVPRGRRRAVRCFGGCLFGKGSHDLDDRSASLNLLSTQTHSSSSLPPMDSFAEPNKPAPGSSPSLADVRAHVLRLEDEHRAVASACP